MAFVEAFARDHLGATAAKAGIRLDPATVQAEMIDRATRADYPRRLD